MPGAIGEYTEPVKLRLALLFALAASATANPSGQPLTFAVAIVRPDGAIVPFAAYDDGRWERAWPEADNAIERAGTIDGTQSIWHKRGERVPRDWTVWPASGAPSIQARVNGIEVAEAHCVGQLALKTNLRPTKAEHPAKYGVAVDSSIPVGPIDEVIESNSVWKSAEQVILSNFSKLEAEKVQTQRSAELPRETPRPVARMTALYREAKSLDSPLYFVAEKKYRTPLSPQYPSCQRITVMTGWLVPTAAGALSLRDAKVFLSDCDEKEVRTAIPLAAVHVAKQVFWVLQEHGYEDETYLIAEIGSTGVQYRLEVNGGGC